MAKKKKEREWKGGKGIKGTVRAAITHHPDKFDADCKDPDRLCPYAIFNAMKKKGFESHYKDQKSTLKGEPKKKAKFKDEDKKEHTDYYSFNDYVAFIEAKEPGTFIFWGATPNKAKYSGKVGGAMWDQFVINASKGYGRCYLIDATSIQEAKGMIEQAAPCFIPNVFVYGEQANAAIARWGKR